MSLESDRDFLNEVFARSGHDLSDRSASDKKVTTTTAVETIEPLVPAEGKTAGQDATRRAQVRISENLGDIIAGIPITPEEAEVLRRRRLLNAYIHKLLTLGLAVSTVTMLVGIALEIFEHTEAPSHIPGFTETLRRLTALQASGFLALGLLVLIMTPILRVAGSFIAFLYEHDWRFAGMTFLVLIILFLSVIFGRG
jgi:uncharacterized membrane protein